MHLYVYVDTILPYVFYIQQKLICAHLERIPKTIILVLSSSYQIKAIKIRNLNEIWTASLKEGLF